MDACFYRIRFADFAGSLGHFADKYSVDAYNCTTVFHSVLSLGISTTPSVVPKTSNTLLTASICAVSLPRSNSETNRRPTPAKSPSSPWAKAVGFSARTNKPAYSYFSVFGHNSTTINCTRSGAFSTFPGRRR